LNLEVQLAAFVSYLWKISNTSADSLDLHRFLLCMCFKLCSSPLCRNGTNVGWHCRQKRIPRIYFQWDICSPLFLCITSPASCLVFVFWYCQRPSSGV